MNSELIYADESHPLYTGDIHDSLYTYVKLQLFQAQRDGEIYKFGQSDRLTINNLTKNAGQTMRTGTFVDFLTSLPSYFALIVNKGVWVVSRNLQYDGKKHISGLDISSWSTMKYHYEDIMLRVKHDYGHIHEFSITTAIETFCLGEFGLAKYNRIISDPNYKGDEFLNIWVRNFENDEDDIEPNPKMFQYIKESLASGSEINYGYIVNWLVIMSKLINKQISVCPVFRINNSIFFRTFWSCLLDEEFNSIDFSSLLEIDNIRKRFIVCDETSNSGWFMSKLDDIKDIITNNNKIIKGTNNNLSINAPLNLCITARDIKLPTIDVEYFPLFMTEESNIEGIDKIISDRNEMNKLISWLRNQSACDISDMNVEYPFYEIEEDWNGFTFDTIIDRLDLDSMLETPRSRRIPFSKIYEEYKFMFEDKVDELIDKRSFYVQLKDMFRESKHMDYIFKDVTGNNNNYLVKRTSKD